MEYLCGNCPYCKRDVTFSFIESSGHGGKVTNIFDEYFKNKQQKKQLLLKWAIFTYYNKHKNNDGPQRAIFYFREKREYNKKVIFLVIPSERENTLQALVSVSALIKVWSLFSNKAEDYAKNN